MPSIICQKCREINEPNATVCQRCGARLCPNCHLVIDSPSASVCPHCGKKDLTFRPGRYSASTYIAPGSQGAGGFGQSYCPNCGSKVDPGVKKCPYCGRLGTLVTQTPVQGYGVMQPAHGETSYTYTSAEAPPPISTQKVCQKCGTPIPPGSSMCPIHGKFGGGNILSEGPSQLPGRHTGDLWRKIEEKRASSGAEQPGTVTYHTPPQQAYPQMSAVPQASKEIYALPETDAQRVCPNCGSAVPDRSKICPACGWNRLPPQRSKPILKAEEFFRASTAAAQPYAAQPYPAAQPPVDQYYGQPGAMPYESMYPPQPVPLEQPYEKKGRKKERRPREARQREAKPQQKQPILPLLLSLLAIVVVMGFAVTYILSELNRPTTPVIIPPTTTNGTGSTTAKAPVISDVEFKDVSRDSAVITWKTDRKSNSIVIYCLEGGTTCENARDDDLVIDHSVKLTGLEPNESYHITVKSNIDGKLTSPESSLEVEQVLRLLGVADTVPPVISNVNSVNVTGSSAKITWRTDELATSQVAYGTSASYGSLQPMQTDTTLTTIHEVMLQGLPPQTTFNFKAVSRDESGNEASSPNAKFTTTAPSGTIIGYIAPDFTLDAADGSQVSLNTLRGKKVIINFWNLDCQWCMSEMPYFQTVRDNNDAGDVAILAINTPVAFGLNRDAYVGEAIKDYTFTVLLDKNSAVSLAYNVTNTLPVTYFLDAQGIVQKFQNGSFENAAAIQSLLDSY
ncbi:MAG: zinc-ribbon domain-containing protein [Dehalococcoidia bacterium]|nr:zinc-ribbon domain-containing protein [Dehalococcoidia bacterium]MDD5493775.1 zinc-ribbon domain-containing protein [Dehalococcoidia bacterium]